MNDDAMPAPSRRRGEKQERSLARRALMEEAAIQLLASHGVAGLTHRLLAQQAGVSLAATTYYFDSKADMVAAASNRTLDTYAETFRRVARSGRRLSIGDYVIRLLGNAAARDRVRVTCWVEIMLDAPRHGDSLEHVRLWFAELAWIWQDIAVASDAAAPAATASSAIDTMIGLLLMMLGLGLDEARLGAVLLAGEDPLTAWVPAQPAAPPPPAIPAKPSRKSAGTRERIIAAATALLIEEGVAAVGYRSVAARAGLAMAGPAYHFPTVASLLAAAQERLFAEAKQRYHAVANATEDGANFDQERLIDRTAAIFLRETTAFAGRNLASFTVWLQAARQPELRPMVWNAVADQQLAWMRVLARAGKPARPLDALCAQALFIGKMIRILATGAALPELETVRRDFAFNLTALAQGDFWLDSRNGTID